MVLKARTLAPDWSAGGNPDKEAKCRKHPLPKNHVVNADTDPFFMDEEEAAYLCNGTFDNYVCPFRARCLERALINNEQAGTFGGLTTDQRKWVRRNSELIPRDEWALSDSWRGIVPSQEFLDQDDEEEPDGDEATA